MLLQCPLIPPHYRHPIHVAVLNRVSRAAVILFLPAQEVMPCQSISIPDKDLRPSLSLM